MNSTRPLPSKLLRFVEVLIAEMAERDAAEYLGMSRQTMRDLVRDRETSIGTREKVEKCFQRHTDAVSDSGILRNNRQDNASENVTAGTAKFSATELFRVAPQLTVLEFETRVNRRNDLDDVVRLMPNVLYDGNRYGSKAFLTDVVGKKLIPFLQRQGKGLKIEPSVRANLALQTACVLNELGPHSSALRLFKNPYHLRECSRLEDYEKILVQIIRNHSSCIGWHKEFGTAEALERLKDAQRAPGAARFLRNEISISNVKCEIYLAISNFAQAWNAAAPNYFLAKKYFIMSDGFFDGPVELGFLHAYAAVYYGAISRLLNQRADNYTRNAQDEDVALLEGCLTRANGEIRIAHLPSFTVKAKLQEDFKRFEKIHQATRRTKFDENHPLHVVLRKLMDICDVR